MIGAPACREWVPILSIEWTIIMKLKTTIDICIVYCIVPALQRPLALVVRAGIRLSGALDNWAWSTARGLNRGPCRPGRNVAWTQSEGE